MGQTLDRITYVEDDADIRAIAEIVLGTVGGYTLDICASGTETLEKAPAFGPDLILLDVMMPGIDGMETFRRLKAIPETSKVPVIFMTAKAQKHEVQAYKDMGAIDVIPKPFDPVQLPRDINAIWTRHIEAGGNSS